MTDPVTLSLSLELFREPQYNKKCRVGPCGFAWLSRYDFPGNVRELKNIIKRSVALTKSGFIDDTIVQYIDREFNGGATGDGEFIKNQTYDLKKISAIFEKMMILAAMKDIKNTRQLAEKLNVSHATVIRKMQRAGIKLRPTA